ncbi:hypothetical protein P3S67_025803 [Capsicum chacoense]
MDTHVDKRVKRPSSAPKAVSISTFEVINVVQKRKKSSSPSGKGVEKSLDIMPFCSDASKPPVSLDGVAIGSAASSSNKSNACQEPDWKCLKKKHKGLSYQHREFAGLDSITIETTIFEDGAVGSTMPLADLAHQLDLVDVSSNICGESEIHVLNKISPLSEIETKELAKLKEIAETSLLQILGHKFFP